MSEGFTDPNKSPIEPVEIRCGVIENAKRVAARV